MWALALAPNVISGWSCLVVTCHVAGTIWWQRTMQVVCLKVVFQPGYGAAARSEWAARSHSVRSWLEQVQGLHFLALLRIPKFKTLACLKAPANNNNLIRMDTVG